MRESPYPVEIKLVAQLSKTERGELAALARACCPQLPGGYVEKRFSFYDALVIGRRDGELHAGLFVNFFESEDSAYIYFGPLFSRRSAFLPMFAAGLKQLCSAENKNGFYLMTEIQHPGVFLLFKSLFRGCSWPDPQEPAVPPAIKAAARTFAARLPHIHGLNSENFSSTSGETLYKGGRKPVYAQGWMAERGIFPERGDNQLLLAHITGCRKKLFFEELRATIADRGKWKSEMQALLETFKKSIAA